MLALAGAAAAEPGFTFATAPGKLPKIVVPIHYAIELEPNLDSLAIAGTETIDIDVREATSQLVLKLEPLLVNGKMKYSTLVELS